MEAFQEVEKLGQSWINSPSDTEEIDSEESNIIIRLIDMIINMSFNHIELFGINFKHNLRFIEYWQKSFDYAIFRLNNLESNQYNHNLKDILPFVLILENIIKNKDSTYRKIIFSYTQRTFYGKDIQFLDDLNILKLLSINFEEIYNNNIDLNVNSNIKFTKLLKINNKIIEIKTKIMKYASIINHNLFLNYKLNNNWIENIISPNRYNSCNKYKFKNIIKVENRFNKYTFQEFKNYYIHNKYDEIKYGWFDNLNINQIRELQSLCGINNQTIIKWIRNKYCQEIDDIDYYLKYEFNNKNITNNIINKRIKIKKYPYDFIFQINLQNISDLQNNIEDSSNLSLINENKLEINKENRNNESLLDSHIRLQNFIKYDEKSSYRSHSADQNDI